MATRERTDKDTIVIEFFCSKHEHEKQGIRSLKSIYRFFSILGLGGLGFLAMGYHPGAEDDAIYLTAVKARLHPSLFPHDAAFFQLQMRFSVFDTFMARLVQCTGLTVGWAALLVQLLSIMLILGACWAIVCQLFEEASARWAGVAMVAAMFTLPVAGTALFILDQYLHSRNPATALLLLAVARILAGKRWQAVPLLAMAFALHPLMGGFGISFCVVLTLTLSEPLRAQIRQWRTPLMAENAFPALALLPFGWVFGTPSPVWQQALRSRHWFRIYQWTWYEWLGALAPLAIFWAVARMAKKRGEMKLERFTTAILYYGLFQQTVAMVLLGPGMPLGLSTLEPMRYLHTVYVFLALVGGALMGRSVLKQKVWRWAAFLLLAFGGMFVSQRELFAGSAHLELPGMRSANPWLQAFEWIRVNTPQDAYFALDPQYMAAEGEDYHSFRALAERSQLADGIKDTTVITKVPELGERWKRELDAQQGWDHFQRTDFERLKTEFGVNWVVVRFPQPEGLDCRWHNRELAVCEVR